MGYDFKFEREERKRLAKRAAARKMRLAKFKILIGFIKILIGKNVDFCPKCNAPIFKNHQNQIKYEELKKREFELFKQEDEIIMKRQQLEEEIRNFKEKQQQNNETKYPQTLQEAFDILGTSSGLTLDMYKKIWKQEVLKYHPDLAAGLGERLQRKAEEEMKIINKAWEIIRSSPY